MDPQTSQTIIVRLTTLNESYFLITARRKDDTQDLFQQIVHEGDGYHLNLHCFVRNYPSLFMHNPGGRIIFTDLVIEDNRSETVVGIAPWRNSQGHEGFA